MYRRFMSFQEINIKKKSIEYKFAQQKDIY
jgi:hypothetical protein